MTDENSTVSGPNGSNIPFTTSCTDWETRIVDGRSLITCPPLFPSEAEAGLAVMKQLRIVDAPGSPTLGEAGAPWVFDIAATFFGSYDPDSGRRQIQDFFISLSKKNSKALALDTPIPVPTGWTTMGALREGDLVFGVDGQPCKVEAVSEVFHNHKCYRLGFSNGESVLADAGHLWVTKSLRDLKTKIRTTEDIAATLYRPGDGARNHSMAMPAAIQCEDADLPIPPYTLGAWLGDGHSAAGKITSMDDEILDAIRADGFTVELRASNGSQAKTYAVGNRDRSMCRRGHVLNEENAYLKGKYPQCRVCSRQMQKIRWNGKGESDEKVNFSLHDNLNQLGVMNDKHIPEIYFRASFAQRLALLQGLMDTDGTINKNGRVISYCGINARLIQGVSELLSTFGIKNSVIARPATLNGRVVGTAYNVQFATFKDVVPVFKLPRKLDRMRTSGDTSNAARSRTVQIISAEEVESVPVKCIRVSAPDHQFLFGRSLLPTHNSTIAAAIMLTVLIRNWRQSAQFLILSPTQEVSMNAFAPCRDMVKHDEELSELLHVQEHLKTITHRGTGATLKIVTADQNTVGGVKGVGVLVDELHLLGKNPHAENMLREATGGLASRPEGFVIYLTTQSDQPPAGVFKQKLQYARDVRDGIVKDNRFLPVLYEFPKAMLDAGQHRLKENFRITNPNMGYSVDPEYIEREFDKAEAAGEESTLGFLSKHLNVEIGLALRSDRWAGADFWQDQSDATISLDSMLDRCEVIDVGIDGGGLNDLLGLALVGREKETGDWLVWCRAWGHPSALQRNLKESSRFQDFKKDGDMSLVLKIGDDVTEVCDIVERVFDTGLLDKIGVDPVGIGAIFDELVARSIPEDKIVGISQGWKLGGAIKTTERRLAEGKLKHAEQPLMAWCVSNCRVEPRANSILITKQASGSAKIDPVMALFNAVSLMALNPAAAHKKFQMLFL